MSDNNGQKMIRNKKAVLNTEDKSDTRDLLNLRQGEGITNLKATLSTKEEITNVGVNRSSREEITNLKAGLSSGENIANRKANSLSREGITNLKANLRSRPSRLDIRPLISRTESIEGSPEGIAARVLVYFNDMEVPIENVEAVIESEVNQHTKLTLKGFLSSEDYEQYLKNINSYAEICVGCIEKEQMALQYEGVITRVSATAEGANNNEAIQNVEITALSHSYLLDITEKSRSFQNEEMNYDELLSRIIGEYEGANFIETVKGRLGTFVLQYQETDWSFLKREASKFEQGLYVDSRMKAPRIIFGMPSGVERGELNSFEYTANRDLQTYRFHKENKRITDVASIDYMTFEVKDDFATETFLVGDRLNYMGHSLTISKVISRIKDHQLYNTYTLGSVGGLRQPRRYSKNQQGLSLIGRVIAVENNKLKVHLEIDMAQPVETACWFDYAAVHSTFYCMPEIGDFVVLNCPTRDAKDALITASIKQDPKGGFIRNNQEVSAGGTPPVGPINFAEAASNPDVKLLTTKSGRMIQLGPDNITVLFDGDTFLVLDDSEGITLHTNQDISLHAAGQVYAVAEEEMILSAGSKISIRNKGSSIELDPARITITSADVRMN